ncbi:MAG: MscL family protein [Candidatus Nanohaloarchaeota archaeon QJJ-5]|nr:MscL family protein [Candidatus Nanohaloarchaeota archaeon QJJ-5]
MKDLTQGFIDFLKEYGVIGLAIAVVIGNATKDLVNSVVDSLIMPLVGILLPAGDWQEYSVMVLSAEIEVGNLLAAVLDFVIIALVIYAFVKYILRKEDVKKV